MAIVQGPLHSDIAHGSLANQLCFRHTNGRATCRKKSKSTKPLTESQELHHTRFASLSPLWAAQSAANRLTWQPLTQQSTISRYAAYMRHNLQLLKLGTDPIGTYPNPRETTMTTPIQWRYGSNDIITAPVDAYTTIAPGDLLYHAYGYVYPATAQTDQGDRDANQLMFAAKFLGIALDPHEPGTESTIRVATAGIFQITVPEDLYIVGQPLAPTEDPSGYYLLANALRPATIPATTIAICAHMSTAPTTSIEVLLHSTVLKGPYPVDP